MDKEKAAPIFINPEAGNTLKVALLGLPNSGKTSLYNALVTPKHPQPTDDFIFTTLKVTKGSFSIPDPRLDWYEKIFASLNVKGFRTIVADGPALVSDSHLGGGEGMEFMEEYRDVDVFYYVLRAWNNPNLTHYDETVDPVRDAEAINQNLLMADLYKIEKLIKDLYSKHDELVYDHQPVGKNNKWLLWTLLRAWHWIVGYDRKEYEIKGKIRKHDPCPTKCDGWPLRLGEWNSVETEMLNSLNLYTSKSVIYILNISLREHTRNRPEWLDKLEMKVKKQELGRGFITSLSVELENNFVYEKLNNTYDKYQKCNPSHVSNIPELNRITASSMNLITFYTGKTPLSTPGFNDFVPEPNHNELYAWRCRQGKMAQDAAGLIDADLSRYFNRLTMYAYEDLIEDNGDFDKLIEFNKNRMQQKRYYINDGDVVDIMGFGLPAVEIEKPKKKKGSESPTK
jgi:ribosome-binding ATPase YchF (GTP1/OBG family)